VDAWVPSKQRSLSLCCSALAEAVVHAGSADAEEFAQQQKERLMTSIKTIAEKLTAWRRYREAVRELSRLNDRELNDIGIRRGDIEFIVRQSIAA
jgi:uncharacterized protein YjiS (DUF1127 family)